MKNKIIKNILLTFFICLIALKIQAQTPFASYPMNGNANDVSGNGWNGTLTGAAGYTLDRFNNANSALNVPSDVSYIALATTFPSNINNFSASLWFSTTSTIAAPLFSFDGNYSLFVWNGQLLMQDKAGLSCFSGWNNTIINTISTNTWYHIVWTRSASGVNTVYLDGVQIYQATLNASTISTCTTLMKLLGGASVGGLLSGQLQIDEMSFYNQILTPTDDLNLYNTTVWNGTAWSNGVPTATQNVTIAGNYNTGSGNISCKNMIIKTGFSVTIGAAGSITTAQNLVNNGTVNNCLGGTLTVGGANSGTGITNNTPATVPTTEASGLVFSGATSTSFTLNWTNGDGANRVVIVKPMTAVSPTGVVNGASYTADTNFAGAGSTIDGTGKVVFNGAGNSVTVTGLTALTTYYVAVFEYNQNACGTTYKTGSPLSGNYTLLLANTLASYPMNGNANDISGNGWNGTLTGAAGYTLDRFNNANSALNVPSDVSYIALATTFPSNINNFSASLWFSATSVTSAPLFVLDGNYGLLITNGQLQMFDKAGVSCFVGWNTTTNTNNTLSANNWYHVVWTRDAFGVNTIYLDGIQVYQATLNAGTISTCAGLTKLLGGANVTGFLSGQLQIDEMSFYNQILTPTDDLNLYNTTVWNGTAWSNGVPTATQNVTIAGNYNTSSGDISCKNMIIKTGFSVTIGATGSITTAQNLVNNGTVNNCLGGTLTVGGASSGTGTTNTAATEPTAEASGVSFSTVITTSFSINWTNGNGAKRVVVVKPTTTVSGTALADGSIYTADTNFGGTGTVVDGTGKVVFNGIGNSVAVTGLTLGTTYQVAIFEYNDNACGANYKTGSPANGSQATLNNTTWNGTAWDNGAPIVGIDGIINGNYSTATNGNITANNLTINATFTLTLHNLGNTNVTNTLTNNGTVNNCAVGTIAFGTFAGNAVQAVAIEPTTEANTITFSTINLTNFTINWTNGDGAKRVVVVKPTTTVSGTALADGSIYTADTNFGGTGTVVDGTGKVVFNGIGNSVAVTGLTLGTTYHVAIFEYNDNINCGANYKTGSPANNNQLTANTTTWNGTAWSAGTPIVGADVILNSNYNTATDGNITANNLTINATFTLTLHNLGNINVTNTLTNNGTVNNCTVGTVTFGTFVGNAIFVPITEPTTAASGLFISNINVLALSFDANWTNGNGAKRIVVVKQGTPINATALTDGVSYVADANFAGAGSVVDGTGKVVYNGNSGTSVSITGLSAGGTYYVSIFEYNENVNCGANYLTTPFPSVLQAFIPPAPFTLPASNISPFSFTANWVGLGLVGTSYVIELSKQANFSQIDFTYTTSNNKYEFLDLQVGSTYYYRVRAFNIAGQSPNSTIIGVSLLALLPPVALDAKEIDAQGFLANWEFPKNGANYFQIDVAEDIDFKRVVGIYSSFVVRGSIEVLVKDLKPYTMYYYRVRAVVGVSTINISANSNIIRARTLPLPPKALEATNIADKTFQANWEEVKDAAAYQIDIATDKDFANIISGFNNRIVSGLSFVAENLPKAPNYFYRLRVVTGVDPSSLTSKSSNVISVLSVPNAPVASEAKNIKDNSFTAAWEKGEEVDGYLLDISEKEDISTTLVGFKDLRLTDLSKEITNLKAGKLYYYRLRAFNKSGNSLYSKIIEVATLPTVPQGLTLVSATPQQISVSWTASQSELSLEYLVDLSSDKSFGNFIIKDQKSTTSANLLGKFENGKTYYVRVKAKHSKNGESTYSEALAIIFKPNTPILQNIVLDKVTENSMELRWTVAEGAESYELDVATDANFSTILPTYRSFSVAKTDITLTNLNSLQQYFCRLRAVNKTGKSENSNVVNAITLPNPTIANVAKNIDSQQFTATWNISTQANNYQLEVSRNEDFTDLLAGFSSSQVINAIETLVTLSQEEKILYYRVRVVATTAGQRLVSRPSNVQKVRFLGTPFGFRTSNLAQTSFVLSWNEVNDANEYEISISIDNFATVLATYKQVKTPFILFEKLEGNRMYQIRVKALSSDAVSSNGATSQMTLPSLPEEVYIRRLSSIRTTRIDIFYLSQAFSRVSNLRFAIDRSDAPNAPFSPIADKLSLADSRSLIYNDVTGTQRLQATYRLRISNEAGEVIYNIAQRIITAVEDDLESSELIMYPNPTVNVFKLQLGAVKARNYTILVYDYIGHLIKSWENIQDINNQTFDISTFAVGRYIVEINADKQKRYLPLVKE